MNLSELTMNKLANFGFALAVFALAVTAGCNKKTTDAVTSRSTNGQAAKEMEKAKPDTVKLASGLQYIIWKKGKGQRAEVDDKVQVHYAGRLSTGQPFDNSYDRKQPFEFQLGKGMVIKGWDEGIAYLNVGDSATFIIPAKLGYGEHGRPGIPGNSTLIFDVQLVNVKKTIKPVPFNVKGLDTLKTASGLKYIMVATTAGTQARPGNNVKVHYTGYFFDGRVFDSSITRGEPIGFALGQGRVIKGWDEGIALLKLGEKARFIIPSKLAYGEQGAGGAIPPNTDLIFDVELVAVN